MKRRTLYALALVGLGVIACGAALRSSPALRGKTFVALEKAWRSVFTTYPANRWFERALPLFAPFEVSKVQVEPGIVMFLDPQDYVARALLRDGAYERESWNEIAQHVPAGGVFVDVGAHIGYYSLLAARAVGPSGRVISVEPNPATVKILRQNAAASNASMINVFPFACADAEGTMDLYAADPSNIGMTSLAKSNAEGSGGVNTVYKVRVRPLDSIVGEAQVSRIDAIKIDVEGAELKVLRGAERILRQHSPVLIVEIVEQQLRNMGTSSDEVKAYLASLGYSPRHMFNNNLEFSK